MERELRAPVSRSISDAITSALLTTMSVSLWVPASMQTATTRTAWRIVKRDRLFFDSVELVSQDPVVEEPCHGLADRSHSPPCGRADGGLAESVGKRRIVDQ